MTNKQTVEIGSNPFRFFGVTYSSTMYALRERDARAMMTIQLIFLVVWVRLPWRHVAPKEIGAGSQSWGFCLGTTSRYFRFSWGN